MIGSARHVVVHGDDGAAAPSCPPRRRRTIRVSPERRLRSRCEAESERKINAAAHVNKPDQRIPVGLEK